MTSPSLRSKKKAIAYALWLCGGVFGAHRLYYEKYATAGAQMGLLFLGAGLIHGRSEFPVGLFFYSIPLNALGAWLLADLLLITFWRPLAAASIANDSASLNKPS